MKIIQLTAENVKKLTAIEINPDGNMVQITGKNGQGKTSVLDAIWWALAGTENVQRQPIRQGEENARIEIKLGTGSTVEMIVERRFTEKSSTLTVKTAEGAKYPSPQKMLDDLLGALTFDPLTFMRQDAKGQFDVLRRLVALDVDPNELDRLNQVDFDTRTGVNRDAKSKRAQAEAIAVPDGLPDTLVDESAMLDRIQVAADENAKIETRKANRERVGNEAAGHRETAKRLRAEAQRLLDEASAAESAAVTLETQLSEAPALPEPTDISELRQLLNAAKETNLGIAARDRRAALVSEAKNLEQRSFDLTKAIDERKAQKLEAISRAKMPVDDLSFGDGIVTYKGVPLDQASDAEQLMVSTAIAAALNPKLRVLRIRDGSLLDDDALVRLAEFATARDFQIWIERVDGSGTVGFVMEDGHLKDAAPTPAAKDKTKK